MHSPQNEKTKESARLIPESELAEAHKHASLLFDLDARVEALSKISCSYFSIGKVTEGISIGEEIASLAARGLLPERGSEILSKLLDHALGVTRALDCLQPLLAVAELAFFRNLSNLRETYPHLGPRTVDSVRNACLTHRSLKKALVPVLAIQIAQDPNRALQVMHWCPDEGVEQTALERLRDCARLEEALDYLWLRVDEESASAASLQPCTEAIAVLASDRCSAKRYGDALALVSKLAEGRPTMAHACASVLLKNLEQLCKHDIRLGLRSLDFLDPWHLNQAKPIMSAAIAGLAGKGDLQFLDEAFKFIGTEGMQTVSDELFNAQDFDGAESAASRMESPERAKMLARVFVAKRDFVSAVGAIKAWIEYEPNPGWRGRDLDEARDLLNQALQRALEVGDRDSIEKLLALGAMESVLQQADLARGHFAFLCAAVASQDAKEVMVRWKNSCRHLWLSPREHFHSDGCNALDAASMAAFAVSGSMNERELGQASNRVAEFVARWLLGGADLDGGFVVAQAIWSRELLLDFLIGELRLVADSGNTLRTKFMLNKAEDLARKSNDFPALAVLGNLSIRLGGTERGRTLTLEAQKLEEQRRLADLEEERRRMDDDD